MQPLNATHCNTQRLTYTAKPQSAMHKTNYKRPLPTIFYISAMFYIFDSLYTLLRKGANPTTGAATDRASPLGEVKITCIRHSGEHHTHA